VLTYEDYAALPNDGRRYEIHDGELSVTPAPGTRHQRILRELHDVVHHHVKARSLGEVFFAPVAVILANKTVVEPDLVYLDPARAGLVAERGIEGAPMLVVEVISPSTPKIDRNTKFQLYARYRVPYYWIVDPDARTIEAYELDGAGYRLVTRAHGTDAVSLPPFPDLALVPESLWP
jgi:Uma2 family endonuclease